jgi:hypothetical protein
LKIRKSYVANAFYAGNKSELQGQITSCFTHRLGPGSVPQLVDGEKKIIGFVAPHAGYIYSGPIAAHGYAALASDGAPDTVVVLGPNHTGHGSGVSIATKGSWETPLGIALIDSTLAEQIRKTCNIIDEDERAHISEHSIEVQLPFIQFLYGGTVKFVPICMMMQDLRTSKEIAASIVEQTKGKHVVVIASSDFTHYEPHEVASRNDKTAINAITHLDSSKLNDLGETGQVTMCGYGPITTLIEVAKAKSHVQARLLSYHTSGEVSGDKNSVVGYASVLFVGN